MAFGIAGAVLTIGSPAMAVPALSLQFSSTTVLADGINATPVLILVQVVNSGTPVAVTAVTSGLSWTVSGTGAAVGDLSVLTDSATVSGTGFLFNGFSPLYDSGTSNINVPPVGWGISAVGNATVATGTTNVAAIDLEIAPGVTSGTFVVSFETTSPLYAFTGGEPSFLSIPFGDLNNGTTLGLITVVPEPSTGTALGGATVLMAGVGIVQRRMRRRRRSGEIIG